MDDFTLWLLIIGCPLAIWLLVAIELYFIFRMTRKKAILDKIKNGKNLNINDFEIQTPAMLYGKPIKIAIKYDYIYFINDGLYFCVNIEDFVSIKNKNGKIIFKLANQYIANTKVFAVKCDNDKLLQHLNITVPDSQEEPIKPKSFKEFLYTSKVRFVIIGVCYIIFFLIFALLGYGLNYFITTALFAAGVAFYILFHYQNSEKECSNLSKAEIVEKKAKNNAFYSKVITICLIVAIGFTGLTTISNSGSSSCGHPSCKENGPFPCYGKNNTCPNYTYCYKDLYCNQCD